MAERKLGSRWHNRVLLGFPIVYDGFAAAVDGGVYSAYAANKVGVLIWKLLLLFSVTLRQRFVLCSRFFRLQDPRGASA